MTKRGKRGAQHHKPKEFHGASLSREYAIWVGIKQRCTNPKDDAYPDYGGRGIQMHKPWLDSFTQFLCDVGYRPTCKHSIDRIDVNGHYEPSNVRWATRDVQSTNTRVVRLITIDGRTQSISAWERERNLAQGQVRSRERSGWPIEQAIMTPSKPGQKTRGRGSRV